MDNLRKFTDSIQFGLERDIINASKNSNRMLTNDVIQRFIHLLEDDANYKAIFMSLWILREGLEPYFVYQDSPLKGITEHPLYKIMQTANELISILLFGNDVVEKSGVKNY